MYCVWRKTYRLSRAWVTTLEWRNPSNSNWTILLRKRAHKFQNIVQIGWIKKDGAGASRFAEFFECWSAASVTAICGRCRPFESTKSWCGRTMGTIPAVWHAKCIWQSVSAATTICTICHRITAKSTIAGRPERPQCHRQCKWLKFRTT